MRVRTVLVELFELHLHFLIVRMSVVAVVMRTTLLHLHLELFLTMRMFVVVVVLVTFLDFDLDLLLLTVVVVVVMMVMLFTEVLVVMRLLVVFVFNDDFELAATKVGADTWGRSRRRYSIVGHRTTYRERSPSQGTRLSVASSGRQRNSKSGRGRSDDDDCSKDRTRMNHRKIFS
ncbi:hypothetical protein C8R42DRAFT_654116 [Lentinula raphanica]|nr:hypothetical protein C8R42DRAFT_654116 [Lentinula raphanica]